MHLTGEAGVTIAGSNAQIGGTAYKADTNIVDMFVGAYGSSRGLLIRITKNSIGDYAVVRKGVTFS